MKLINLKTKKGVVNLFADFIISKIDSSLDTIIQVTDFNHFLIVNGTTESNELLDLKKIKDEFVSENQTLIKEVGYNENLSIMDLIQYNKKITESKNRFLWSLLSPVFSSMKKMTS